MICRAVVMADLLVMVQPVVMARGTTGRDQSCWPSDRYLWQQPCLPTVCVGQVRSLYQTVGGPWPVGFCPSRPVMGFDGIRRDPVGRSKPQRRLRLGSARVDPTGTLEPLFTAWPALSC